MVPKGAAVAFRRNGRGVVAASAPPAVRSEVAGQPLGRKASALSSAVQRKAANRRAAVVVYAVKEGEKLDRPLRVAVVGGGPAGACAAESLAKSGVETFLFERKLDNCKVIDDSNR